MSDAQVRGKVYQIDETKTYGQKGFRKRQVVLEQDNGRFTNYIPFEFVHEGCDTVDQLEVGMEIEIDYRLSGRKWQKDEGSEVRFFLNAEALRFRVLGEKDKRRVEDANDDFAEAAYEDDDIPF